MAGQGFDQADGRRRRAGGHKLPGAAGSRAPCPQPPGILAQAMGPARAPAASLWAQGPPVALALLPPSPDTGGQGGRTDATARLSGR